jgi:uncharacterized protein (TIGR02145 family)
MNIYSKKAAFFTGAALVFISLSVFGCGSDSSISSEDPSSSSIDGGDSSSSSFLPSSSSVIQSSSSDGGDSSSSSSEESSSSGDYDSSSSSFPSSSSSIIQSSSSSIGGVSSSSHEVSDDILTDARDGKEYKTVKIGEQLWMAENLNFNASGSKCYGNEQSNCVQYGRLYDFATAMAFESSCNSSSCESQIQSKHSGICPDGYHVPTNADWDALFRYVDGTSGTESPYKSPTAGRKLKAQDGWSSCGPVGSGESYVCEDAFGFSALPGGGGSSGGDFNYVGYDGGWWSAAEYRASYAYFRYMGYYYEDAYWRYYVKSGLFSVRCVKDISLPQNRSSL